MALAVRADRTARRAMALLRPSPAPDIDQSKSPAAELPRIDRRARNAGTSLEGSCHALMHEVGRRYGAEHHVTLDRLMDFIPRSNDPTCSAGFGMGLVMYLGPQIIVTGGRSALAQCMRLPTRYRSYTCVHGIGHALMRAYHGRLRQSVQCVPQARSAGAGLRAGRVPRLLDLLARRRRHGPQVERRLAALSLQRPPLVRAPLLVPLLRRAGGRSDPGQPARDSHRVRGIAPAAAVRLRERARRSRFRRIRWRRRASARGSRAGMRVPACAVSPCRRCSGVRRASARCSRCAGTCRTAKGRTASAGSAGRSPSSRTAASVAPTRIAGRARRSSGSRS